MSISKRKFDYGALCNCTEALVSALKHRDIYTQIHSQHVIDLSEEIGKACNLSEIEISMLKVGACFHDIGKVGIPDEILLKLGELNSEEWDIMKTHSVKGEDIVKRLMIENGDIIAKAVRHHHEFYNGLGYPDQIAGEQISIFSRIISVADSYDAMTVTRSYHKAKTHQQAMEIILMETGDKFDPYVTTKFGSIIENSNLKAD